ncbi:hypothetical protein FGO68_gene839 [Halteria grandinella]|uniref:Uncharacterized protein n=1 Tax=Halteria grandinella TaxID=5974 RepID=A0A8J8T8V1_HALGN|nr:hypothetical protein FGO68_gene839 [Halteria grandinella]
MNTRVEPRLNRTSFDQKPQLSKQQFKAPSQSMSTGLRVYQISLESHLSVKSTSMQIIDISIFCMGETMPGIGTDTRLNEMMKERSFIIEKIQLIAKPLRQLGKMILQEQIQNDTDSHKCKLSFTF